MNSVQLVGRLTRDPDVRYTDGGTTVARFTLAVDRRFKKDGGDEADFISCVAFGKTAEFLEKWFRKGQHLGLTGRIQTGSYVNQEGTKIYTTDVVTENVEFVES
ncbi:single-stranded DNA-binding protein, partial [Enterocloster lavalensis]|uniref:single-stranded DNA-binding protein n=2 Tax=Enterocloster TaxID=2719313 RepID=UPI002FDA2A97